MNYYKITNEIELHQNMQYQDGLNIDVLPFNPKGDCESGGIYFSSIDVLAFLDYGPWIRRVIIPEGETVYENPDYPKKYKAHSVFLEPRRKIDFNIIKELIEEGANIYAGNSSAIKWAAKNGYLDVIKFLEAKGLYIHTCNDSALYFASEYGHLDVVKFLIEKGANIHALDDYAFRLASLNGHLDIVKFLFKKGAYMHALDSCAFRWAKLYNQSKIVKFIIKKSSIYYKIKYLFAYIKYFQYFMK
mgnify:CR=1 FL=1